MPFNKNHNASNQTNRVLRDVEKRNYCETATSENDGENSLMTSVVPPIWFSGAMADLEKRLVRNLEERLISELNRHKDEMKQEIENLKSQIISDQKNRMTHFENQCKSHLQDQDEKLEIHNKQIQTLSQEVATLKELVGSHEKKEAERLSQNLILSGRAMPEFTEGENTALVAVEIFKNKFNLSVPRIHISSANRIGKPPTDGKPDKRKIIMRLTNKDVKNDVVITNIKNRVADLFINEELTKTVDGIYYQLRKLKKENPSKIATLYTRDGVIKVKKTKVGQPYSILTEKELDTFMREADLL